MQHAVAVSSPVKLAPCTLCTWWPPVSEGAHACLPCVLAPPPPGILT